LPFASPFVRHTALGIRLRYPNCSGIARAQRREHHADLHACDAEAGIGCAESVGPLNARRRSRGAPPSRDRW
jgi:hypothetical protein